MQINPWGLFLVALGVVLIILAVKGTQDEALSAVTGGRAGAAADQSAPASTTSGSSSGPAQTPSSTRPVAA